MSARRKATSFTIMDRRRAMPTSLAGVDEQRPDDAPRWLRAFPRDIHVDVLLALNTVAVLAPSPRALRLTEFSMDSHRRPRGLRVDTDPIDPPARQYLDPLHPDDLPPGTPVLQRDIIGCIYSRHHDGYLRHTWANELVKRPHRWVVPYLLQLAGEYVVEIVEDLIDGLDYLADPTSDASQDVGRVIAENPAYVQLTAARAASYWDCYYRSRYRQWPQYPGARMLKLLGNAADHVIDQSGRNAAPRFSSPAARTRPPRIFD